MAKDGEKPLEAALRGFTEETGLPTVDLVWGQDYYETESYSHGERARYYIGLATQHKVVLPVTEELGCPEHDECCCVSAPEVDALLVPRVGAALRWALGKLSRRDS